MSHNSIVLIVDDEEIIQKIIEGLLLNQGYQLATASNGKEALEKAEELTPDLILLDVMMPDMDGFEVCKRLRQTPHLAEVPIIIITALDNREAKLQGIKAGADDFLTKPFDGVELQARVQTITRLNRYRRLMMERNKFEWVVKQDNDGYLMLSSTEHILYANPQARKYLGISLDDNDKPIEESFIAWVNKQYLCEPATAWTDWPNPLLVKTPLYLVKPESAKEDGLWLQVDLMDMSDSANTGYLIRLHDITTSIIAQKLRWTFHAQVSHKLRTPLSKLTGFLSVLKENSDLSDKEKETILDTANNSARQLQAEILSIFDYMASLERDSPNRSPIYLADIPNIISKINTQLNIDPINITISMDDDLEKINLSISYQTMELTLWEILKNAQKFHPQKSPTLDVLLSKNDSKIRLQIADNGLTLTQKQLNQMWIPYYQIEKGFSGQIPGMGLGLSTMASLILNVGGTCRSYNKDPAPGIVIDILLPIVDINE